MKIQIDTKEKIIRIEEKINLKEFIGTLKKLLPGEWEGYKLDANTVIYDWSNPVIIREWPQYPHNPSWPWWGQPLRIDDTNTDTSTYIDNGKYNIETDICDTNYNINN